MESECPQTAKQRGHSTQDTVTNTQTWFQHILELPDACFHHPCFVVTLGHMIILRKILFPIIAFASINADVCGILLTTFSALMLHVCVWYECIILKSRRIHLRMPVAWRHAVSTAKRCYIGIVYQMWLTNIHEGLPGWMNGQQPW